MSEVHRDLVPAIQEGPTIRPSFKPTLPPPAPSPVLEPPGVIATLPAPVIPPISPPRPVADTDPEDTSGVISGVTTGVITTAVAIEEPSSVGEHDTGASHPDADETGRLLRPYAITGGRTGTDGPVIDLEAQVYTTTRGTARIGSHRWEAARIMELADHPIALVELAARLEVPIGVTRVIVADLVEEGSVRIHVPETVGSFTSLLERVLDGVREL